MSARIKTKPQELKKHIEPGQLNQFKKVNPFSLDMYWDEESEKTFVKIVAACQDEKIDATRTFNSFNEALEWIEYIMVDFGWEKSE